MKESITHRSEPEPCPYCGKMLNADTGITDDTAPSPGDVGICWGCLEPTVYDEHLHRRRPTAIEAVQIAANPIVQTAIQRARAYRGSRKP